MCDLQLLGCRVRTLNPGLEIDILHDRTLIPKSIADFKCNRLPHRGLLPREKMRNAARQLPTTGKSLIVPVNKIR